MTMFKQLLLAFVTTACTGGLHQRTQPEAAPGDASLYEALADTYAVLQPSVSDEAGWVDTDRCDAILWASLRASSGVSVNVDVAQDATRRGRWYRRPVSKPECYATGASTSTISRDMLLGVMWWAWTARRADVVRDLWSYGERRGWAMGDGRLFGADTILNSNLIGLLGRLCVALDANCGGASASAAQIPLTWDGSAAGYTRHLETLQILLLGEVDGELPTHAVERLRTHADEQSWNPLFAAALVLYDEWSPIEVDRRLADYPRDRLPTSADWCSAWRTETEGPGPIAIDGQAGWHPCPNNGRTHSGGDVLFIRRVLRGRQ